MRSQQSYNYGEKWTTILKGSIWWCFPIMEIIQVCIKSPVYCEWPKQECLIEGGCSSEEVGCVLEGASGKEGWWRGAWRDSRWAPSEGEERRTTFHVNCYLVKKEWVRNHFPDSLNSEKTRLGWWETGYAILPSLSAIVSSAGYIFQ